MKRIEDNLRDLWNNNKRTNIRIIGVPEEEKKKGSEKIFEEITVENFPNMGKEIIQVQQAQRVPYRINPNRPTPRHIIIKMAKDKERILKAAGEKQRVIYKGTLIRLTADFFAETLQARKEWYDILKVLKGKHFQPRIPASKIIIRIEGEIKNSG